MKKFEGNLQRSLSDGRPPRPAAEPPHVSYPGEVRAFARRLHIARVGSDVNVAADCP
jgi:hypothetical protein